MSDLGIYAAASSLAMAPYLAIARITGTVSLPVMAKAQNDPNKFHAYYGLFAEGLALLGALFVVTMIFGGQTLIVLLLGRKYADAAALATWMAFGQIFRILRGAPTCAALAKGDSVNTMLANLFRLSGLVLAVPIVLLRMDMLWIAVAGGLGEVAALAVSIVRLRRRHGVPLSGTLYPAGLVMVLVSVAFVVKAAFAPSQTVTTLALAALGCLVSLGVYCAVFAQLRRAASSLIAEVVQKMKSMVRTARLSSEVSGV